MQHNNVEGGQLLHKIGISCHADYRKCRTLFFEQGRQLQAIGFVAPKSYIGYDDIERFSLQDPHCLFGTARRPHLIAVILEETGGGVAKCDVVIDEENFDFCSREDRVLGRKR
jgi:hypothetical protein